MEHDTTAQMIADQINLSPSRKDEYQDLPSTGIKIEENSYRVTKEVD
tara:strand:+ start:138 stop:278 length:141 start_codon:yes stop_codon:yes gene_type:complete